MQTDSRRLRSLIVSPVAVAMELLAARFSLCQVKTSLTVLAVFSSCFYPSAEKTASHLEHVYAQDSKNSRNYQSPLQ